MNVMEEHQAFLAKQTRQFERFCRQLRHNGIVRHNSYVEIDSDCRAIQLAEALQKNQSLQVLLLQMWPAEMTHRGARSLGKAVRSSALKSLTVCIEQYGDEVTECMWRFYSNALANIQELDIRYDLNDVDAMELGALLRGHRSLRKLSLWLDDVTEEGALELSKGIQNSKISHLELRNASPEICQTLLSSGVMRLRSLRHVEINDDPWQEYDAPFPQDWSVFGGLAKQSAAACLRRASVLETIKLNECYLNNEEAMVLAEAIRGNCNLKVLCLFGNQIRDDGAAVLAVSCRSCSQLEMLDLGLNQIGVAGCCHLLTELSAHSSLKSLDLSFNTNIGREGLSSIAEQANGMALPFHLPRELNLRSCELTDMDMVALFSDQFCATDLRSLQLASNDIEDDGVESLVSILNNGLTLEELHISYNKFSDVGLRRLVVMTSTHPTLKVLNVCGCKGFTYHNLAMMAKDLTNSKLLSFHVGVDEQVVDANSVCGKAQCKARKAAAHALLKALKGNMHLQKLDLFLMDIPEKVKSDIRFFLDLDKSGRQLLRLDDGGLQPFGLWSHVLAKSSINASIIYYLLGEQPWLIPAFQITAKQAAPNVASAPIRGSLPMTLAESFFPRSSRVTKKRPMTLAESFFPRASKKNHTLVGCPISSIGRAKCLQQIIL